MPSYNLDLTGGVPANVVVDEQHTIGEYTHNTSSYIVPVYAPFYADTMVITVTTNGTTRTLSRYTDYVEVLDHISLTRSTGQQVAGGIMFNDPALNQSVCSLTYDTVGGALVNDRTTILRLLADMVYNPRITGWDTITGVPPFLTPAVHPVPASNVNDYGTLVSAIQQLTGIQANRPATVVNFNAPGAIVGGGVQPADLSALRADMVAADAQLSASVLQGDAAVAASIPGVVVTTIGSTLGNVVNEAMANPATALTQANIQYAGTDSLQELNRVLNANITAAIAAIPPATGGGGGFPATTYKFQYNLLPLSMAYYPWPIGKMYYKNVSDRPVVIFPVDYYQNTMLGTDTANVLDDVLPYFVIADKSPYATYVDKNFSLGITTPTAMCVANDYATLLVCKPVPDAANQPFVIIMPGDWYYIAVCKRIDSAYGGKTCYYAQPMAKFGEMFI